MKELIEREIYWFRKLEREDYYKPYSVLHLQDALEVISRIENILESQIENNQLS